MWEIESIASKGEYLYARVPNHPNATRRGYVLLHRIVMENSLNRLLSKDEVVHHLNKDKKDNRLENLQVMLRSEHTKEHNKPPAMINLVCTECGLEFPRRANQRAAVKGYKNGFCSQPCNGRYQRRKQLHASVSQLPSKQ